MKRELIKCIVTFAIAVLLCYGICLEAQATEVAQSGRCGPELSWTLDATGTLTISGNGAMSDWSAAYDAAEVPWSSCRDQIIHVVIQEGVTHIGEAAFYLCDKMETIRIAETVESIGREAFWQCSALRSVKIPDAVSELGNWIFASCTSLRELDIGNGVQSLEMYTVYECHNLEIVRIGSGLKELSSVSFYGTENVKQVHITDLRAWAEVECGGYRGTPMQGGVYLFLNGRLLETLEIPEGTTHIGSYAFSRCLNITEVVIPDSVTTIGDSAFYKMAQLRKVTVGSGLTQTGEHVFRNCPMLTDVIFSDDCSAHLDRYAFTDCASLINVNTGGVTWLEDSAFWNCTALQTITFGSKLQRLDSEIFENCTALKEIIFTGATLKPQSDTYATLDGVIAYYPKNGTGYYGSGVIWVPYSDPIHTWDAGKVTLEAKCDQYGRYTYTCTQCTTTYFVQLPKDTEKHNLYEGWVLDKKWHCHKCMDCGEVWDFAEHTPGPVATETEPQICTVCQMVLVSATGHIHRGEQWITDSQQHWKECACGEIVQLGGHRHSGPCDDACDVCGYVREEYHAWVAGSCSYCGAKDPNYVPPQVPEEQPATDPTAATTQPTVAPTDPTSPTAPTEPDIPKESGDAQHTLWLILVLVVVAVAAVLTVILLRKKT
jgi:hypothetical protein